MAGYLLFNFWRLSVAQGNELKVNILIAASEYFDIFLSCTEIHFLLFKLTYHPIKRELLLHWT
jgi:hypothetical protein